MMNHFAESVPTDIRQNLLDRINHYVKEKLEYFNLDAYTFPKLDVIEGKPHTGFIPHQRGGYTLTAFFNAMYEPITDKQAIWQDKQREDCETNFLEEEELPLDTEIEGELQERFEEFESFWFEEEYAGLLRYEVWVKDEEDKVFCRLSIGYADCPYFRSCNDEIIWEHSVTFKELKQPREKLWQES